MRSIEENNSCCEKIELYKILLDTRNMEIKLFWQRSNYFLVLNSAMAVGFISQLGPNAENEQQWIFRLLFAILGFFTSVLWVMVCLGGRFWQTKWEGRISEFERWQLNGVDFFSSSDEDDRTDAEIGMNVSGKKWPLKKWYNQLALMKPSVNYAMFRLSVLFALGWMVFIILQLVIAPN